ncbi:MAG TPA: Ig-like domain-containing protein, partial [Methanoregulaceae archaeon]|nr:Ig-like domain-containing protein [Methanoregulaceae archaeon]
MAEYLYRMIIARLALAMLLLLLLLSSSASGMYDQPGRYYDWGDFSSLEEARMWYEDARSPVTYDCSVTIRENTFAEILLGAADPDGDALSYVICTGPSNGTLVTQNGNAVVYAPCKNFAG